MSFQGVDIRATTDRLLFRALLLDSAGAKVATGTTTLRLYELQSDGALKSYDFSDNTFKSTALTTPTLAMTHRTGNNATFDTGLWTVNLTTLTGFVVGSIYLAGVNNTGASPADQMREFQFGNAEGNQVVNASGQVDLDLEQALDSTPTPDTTGDSLWNTARSLPNGDLPGSASGLVRVSDLSAVASPTLRLVNTIMQASSTTTALIADAADLPTDTDDIYNGLLIIARDVSASNKPNVRFAADFAASTNTFTLDEALDFTPQTGVDTFEVWAITTTSSGLLTELAKVTTGFAAANPNNLNSYLKAMMSKVATLPTGLGTYDVTTDALEVLRERLDLMTGTGFGTSTDSLKAIRDAIDDLLAPVVVAAGGSAGVGFLSECVSLVRKATDEPSITPKYTDADIIEYIHSAFDQVTSALNIDTDHPVLVRYDIAVVNGTQEYLLPSNVGEIWRIARIDTTTQLPIWELWPSNEFTFSGYGFTVEGNILRFGTPQVVTQTLQVLYVPGGEVSLHTATSPGGGSSATIILDSTPTEGTYDARPNAYAGHSVRTLAGTGLGQERIAASSSGTTVTVRPAWGTTPDNTTVYELIPQYSRLIKHVVVLYAAMDILGNEAKSQRRAELEKQLQRKMTALRNTIGKKVNRFGSRGPGVDTIDNQDLWPLIP